MAVFLFIKKWQTANHGGLEWAIFWDIFVRIYDMRNAGFGVDVIGSKTKGVTNCYE